MTLLLSSAINIPPSGATATPIGKDRRAAVAGPQSPEYPATPVPAIVAMRPSPALAVVMLVSRKAAMTCAKYVRFMIVAPAPRK